MTDQRDVKLLAVNAGVFPTKQQTLLLQACLFEGSAAAEALQKWSDGLSTYTALRKQSSEPGLPQVYDQLDLGSQRLLSLLYKNGIRQGFTHPIVRQLEGYYKYIWYRNNLLKSALSNLIKELKLIGVEPIVFKGIVQIEKYYNDFGVRPTTDLDIIIHPADAEKTVSLLLAKNWTSAFGDPHRISTSQIHAHTFKQGHIELDLHIRFSPFSLLKETTDSFWRESAISKYGYRTLHPAHELFLTMLHAYQWNFIPPIRWVADCKMLTDHFTSNDWTVFRALVASERFDIHGQMLEYLASIHLVKPELPLSANRAAGNEIEQQIIYGLTPQSENQFAGVRRLYLKIRQESNTGVAGNLRALLGHYLYVWDKKNYMELLSAGVVMFFKKGFRQIRK